MSQGGILGIGSSALLAYQRAMQVTGHNIANVGTEGYSRQRLELGTRRADLQSYGAIGNGVQPTGVVRMVDDYVQARIGTASSAEGYQRTLLEFSRELDGMLADSRSGLSPALQEFFAAVQDVASDPASIAARQQLLAQAGTLTDRFAQLEGSIAEQRAAVSGRMRTAVDEINQLSSGIAGLNAQIAEARGAMGNGDPNDLLDQREQLVSQLSERVAISTVEQGDGTLNVYMGRGQPLVIGSRATEFYAQPMGADPQRLDIAMRNGQSMVVVTEQVTGGELGALLEVRDSVLDAASSSLGRMAVTVADAFNGRHTRNMDLRGEAGGALFAWSLPGALAQPGNSASGLPQVAVADTAGLEASDYELRFDGAQWNLRRLSDGRAVGTAAPGEQIEVDGLRFDLAPVTGAAAGDRFLLRPLRVADRLEVMITDPRAIAAALPVTAEPAAGSAGRLSVQVLDIQDPDDTNLRVPAQIRFTGGAFEVDGQRFLAGPDGDTEIAMNGWRVVLRGQPAEGDVVDVRDNAGASGDNRGALALAALAGERLMAGGTASLGDAYGELVADVGVRTRRAEINADVQARLLQDARAQRENVSGVNLDEEAANLLRFQQAYQAAAQVVATANTLFETLLAAVRR